MDQICTWGYFAMGHASRWCRGDWEAPDVKGDLGGGFNVKVLGEVYIGRITQSQASNTQIQTAIKYLLYAFCRSKGIQQTLAYAK